MNDRDQELLSAYLDGELLGDEQARVEQWLASDESFRALHDELRALRVDLETLPRYRVPEGFAERVLAKAVQAAAAGEGIASNGEVAADEQEPVERLPQQGSISMSGRSRWVWPLIALAAALLIMLFNPGGDEKDVARNEAPEAASEDTQPAATDAVNSKLAARDRSDNLKMSMQAAPQEPGSADGALQQENLKEGEPAANGLADSRRDSKAQAGAEADGFPAPVDPVQDESMEFGGGKGGVGQGSKIAKAERAEKAKQIDDSNAGRGQRTMRAKGLAQAGESSADSLPGEGKSAVADTIADAEDRVRKKMREVAGLLERERLLASANRQGYSLDNDTLVVSCTVTSEAAGRRLIEQLLVQQGATIANSPSHANRSAQGLARGAMPAKVKTGAPNFAPGGVQADPIAGSGGAEGGFAQRSELKNGILSGASQPPGAPSVDAFGGGGTAGTAPAADTAGLPEQPTDDERFGYANKDVPRVLVVEASRRQLEETILELADHPEQVPGLSLVETAQAEVQVRQLNDADRSTAEARELRRQEVQRDLDGFYRQQVASANQPLAKNGPADSPGKQGESQPAASTAESKTAHNPLTKRGTATYAAQPERVRVLFVIRVEPLAAIADQPQPGNPAALEQPARGE